MKVIDLIVKSKHHVNAEINKICGGKSLETFWITGFQKGIGGLTFTDPAYDDEDKKFMVALAMFKSGVGIYCRNMYANNLILIPENEIIKLAIKKNEDVVKPFRLSPFLLIKKLGFSEHTASKYLIPKEIIKESKASLFIHTDEKFIQLDLEKISPADLVSLIKKTKFVHLLQIDISPIQILTAVK